MWQRCRTQLYLACLQGFPRSSMSTGCMRASHRRPLGRRGCRGVEGSTGSSSEPVPGSVRTCTLSVLPVCRARDGPRLPCHCPPLLVVQPLRPTSNASLAVPALPLAACLAVFLSLLWSHVAALSLRASGSAASLLPLLARRLFVPPHRGLQPRPMFFLSHRVPFIVAALSVQCPRIRRYLGA